MQTSKKDTEFKRATEARMKNRLSLIWKKQMNYFLRESKSLTMFRTVLKRNAVTPTDTKEIAGIVKNMPGKEEFLNFMTLYWSTAIVTGGKSIVKELKLGDAGISYSLKNKEAIAWLKNKAVFESAPVDSPQWTKARDFLRLSDYKGNITHTTKERIKEILTKAADEGWSYSRTSKAIQAEGDAGVFSQARGEMIATNEIGIAYEEGKLQVMDYFAKQFPERLPQKSWLTANDEKVRPEHMANQNQGWIPIVGVFTGTGSMNAPTGVHCRCSTLYRIEPPKK